MLSHWEAGIKVKELIIEEDPYVVMELGAGSGRTTLELLALGKKCIYELITVNDNWPADIAESLRLSGVTVIEGISYLELAKMPNQSVDIFLIDTDHNGWTLDQELEQCERVSTKGGIVIMHDTETYGKNQGEMGDGYGKNCKVKYPADKIHAFPEGMIDVIERRVREGKWEIIRRSAENHGAIAMRRT